MAYTPNTPNGQATMANSEPVVISSDQSAFPITLDKTNFTQSSGNNTSAQLAASATFTGSIESGLSHPNLIISVRCDQPFTMTIKQYSDLAGTIAYPNIVYTRLANVGYNDTITLAGSYFQVVLQNTGASTTTNLFVETWMGILPVSINPTNLGNNPTSINEVGGTALTVGQKASALSIPVTLSNENVQDLYFTGQATQTATINNIIPSTASTDGIDLTGYRSGSVQIFCPTGTYTTGAIIFEGCNNSATGTIWQTIPVFNIANATPITAAITLVSNTSIIYHFPVNFRYVRVRISTAVSGASASVQAFSKFSQTNWTPAFTNAVQGTAANFNVTPASTPLMTGAIASAAASDATTNPTGYGNRVFGHTFNGTTWDRPYNNQNTTTGDTGTKTASFTGATQTNFNNRGAYITVLCGTVSGTIPTLNAQLQFSPDGGTTWIAVGAASSNVTATGNTIVFQVYPTNHSVAGATPTALTTGGTATVQINTPLPRTWRLNYTIGGTTPSFAITAVYVNYIA